MAFPVIESTADYTTDADSTSHSVTMPSGITAGDYLLAICAIDGTRTGAGQPGEVTGWERIADLKPASGGTTTARLVVFQKEAAGSDTLTIPLTQTERLAARVYRISGVSCADIAEIRGTSTATSLDPPSLTSYWGSGRDTLWITAVGYDDGTKTLSAYPSGWSNTANVRVASSTGVGLGVATLTSTNATENPGAFTLSSADEWAGVTIALHASAPTSPISVVEILTPSDNGTPTWGSLHQDGDVAVYFAALSTTADAASLSGWTVIQTAPYVGTSYSNVAWAAYKVLDGTESGSIGTPTVTDGSWDESSVVVFRGVDTTTPIDVTGSAQHQYLSRPGPPTLPGITTVTDNALVVAFEAMNYNVRPGMGSSWTLGWSRSRPAKYGGENYWWRVAPTAGATGDQSIVWPDNDAWYSGFLFALRPAVTNVSASVVATPVAVPTPTELASATISSSPVATPAAVPTPTETASAELTSTVVATPAAVPAATALVGTNVSSSPVATPAAVPDPTETATATLTADPVATPVAVPAAGIVSIPVPDAVPTPVALPTPSLTATAAVSSSVVPTPVAVPAATLTATATLTPSVVPTPVALPAPGQVARPDAATPVATPVAVPTPAIEALHGIFAGYWRIVTAAPRWILRRRRRRWELDADGARPRWTTRTERNP